MTLIEVGSKLLGLSCVKLRGVFGFGFATLLQYSTACSQVVKVLAARHLNVCDTTSG